MIKSLIVAFAKSALANEFVVCERITKDFLAYYNMQYGLECMQGYSVKMIRDRFYRYMATGYIER